MASTVLSDFHITIFKKRLLVSGESIYLIFYFAGFKFEYQAHTNLPPFF